MFIKRFSATTFIRSFSTRPTTLVRPRSLIKPPPFYRSPPRLSLVQHRSFSLWNIPLSLITASSPWKRRVALVGLGGAGLAITVILGPFLLVGVGGVAAVIGFRVWRFKRQIQQELEKQTSSNLSEWPDFLNAFLQQRSFFGQDQRHVQNQVIAKVNAWRDSMQGRHVLESYGLPEEDLTQHVSMRGSASSTTHNGTTEIKIELALDNSPGSVLIAKAVKDKGGVIMIKEIQLVTWDGQEFMIPLSTQNKNGGRIIEGEFHDV